LADHKGHGFGFAHVFDGESAAVSLMFHRGERRTMTTKQVRETEAEAVAFVVCQSVGLQNGTASQDYIQLWHGDANLLRESLEAVQQTAAVILGGIAP
jgi:DNA transposition AAA+ family ATPase